MSCLTTLPKGIKDYLEQTNSCPLCANKNFKLKVSVRGMDFFECVQCKFRIANPYLNEEGMGLLYTNSEILSEVNPHLENYYEYKVGEGMNQTRKDYLRVLDSCRSFLGFHSSKPTLFEVGYGTGSFLLEAVHKGWNVDGVDTSEENQQLLVNNENLNVQSGSFSTFSADESNYDVVALWDVIEHTIDPSSFVKKAKLLLNHGGLLVLATPNIGGLLNKVAEFLYNISFGALKVGVKQLYVPEHVGYFSPKTLKKLVVDQGFIVKEVVLTETDLQRYGFSPLLKVGLSILFFFARLLRMQNRVIIIAQKP